MSTNSVTADEAKKKVLAVYPDAHADYWGGWRDGESGYNIKIGDARSGSGLATIGSGETEDAAWIDAASRLPDSQEIEPQQDTKCSSCDKSIRMRPHAPNTRGHIWEHRHNSSVFCDPSLGFDSSDLASPVPAPAFPQEKREPQGDAEEIVTLIQSKFDMSRATPADWVWETLAVLEARSAAQLPEEPRQSKECVDCRDYEANIRGWIEQLGGDTDTKYMSMEMERLIDKLSTPAPEEPRQPDGWKPVGEGLPKHGGQVEITFWLNKWNGPFVTHARHEKGHWDWNSDIANANRKDEDVTAWRDLPKPYQSAHSYSNPESSTAPAPEEPRRKVETSRLDQMLGTTYFETTPTCRCDSPTWRSDCDLCSNCSGLLENTEVKNLHSQLLAATEAPEKAQETIEVLQDSFPIGELEALKQRSEKADAELTGLKAQHAALEHSAATTLAALNTRSEQFERAIAERDELRSGLEELQANFSILDKCCDEAEADKNAAETQLSSLRERVKEAVLLGQQGIIRYVKAAQGLANDGAPQDRLLPVLESALKSTYKAERSVLIVLDGPTSSGSEEKDHG